MDCIHRLADGQEVEVPWYDFVTGNTGGWRKMQGDKDAIIIAEGIHMLNPLIFDRLRSEANGIYVAPGPVSSPMMTRSSGPSSCGWCAA